MTNRQIFYMKNWKRTDLIHSFSITSEKSIKKLEDKSNCLIWKLLNPLRAFSFSYGSDKVKFVGLL